MNLKEELGEWYELLSPEFKKPYMVKIGKQITLDLSRIQPALSDILRVYRECPPAGVKVVIMGQDPYYNGTADGFAFSTRAKTIPASLRVIFKELERTGYGLRTNADLTDWVSQGVFLLNASLTTTSGVAGAHKSLGWEKFIQATLAHIINRDQPYVFIAWGRDAQNIIDKATVSKSSNWMILKGIHPAATLYNPTLSFDTNHFNLTNEYLVRNNKTPIKWV